MRITWTCYLRSEWHAKDFAYRVGVDKTHCKLSSSSRVLMWNICRSFIISLTREWLTRLCDCRNVRYTQFLSVYSAGTCTSSQCCCWNTSIYLRIYGINTYMLQVTVMQKLMLYPNQYEGNVRRNICVKACRVYEYEPVRTAAVKQKSSSICWL